MRNMNCVVFLTDNRLVAAAKSVCAHGYQVFSAATLSEAKQVLLIDAQKIDCVVLPIRGTDDGTVEFDDGKADISPLLKGLKPGIPVFTAHKTAYLQALGLNIQNAFENEAVALANAPLTAEGVLWMLLEKTPRSLTEYTYDVLGMGKTGCSICALLNKLGLQVRSFARNGKNDALPLSVWEKSNPSDVVIVTIPARVITKKIVARWNKPVTIIDIAS
ncbi:MAG TPA: hypothetical protein VN626_05165, partial [Clostridia bacterium]|nr:hypothetical protein [Clostridia bacterium]